MADLRRQVEQIKTVEDVKVALQRMLTAQQDSKYKRQDLVFLDEDRGIIVRNPDNGHYYRVTVSGTTPAVTLTDVGTKV